MYNFFPVKEVVEEPQDDQRFTCPTCQHFINHLDGTQHHLQNNRPNPNSTQHGSNPQPYYPPCYSTYFMAPPSRSMGSRSAYGMPPPPYPHHGYPSPPPFPGYQSAEEGHDLKLSDEDWNEVYIYTIQAKAQWKQKEGKKFIIRESNGRSGEQLIKITQLIENC